MNALPSARGQDLIFQHGQWQIDLGRRELLSNGVAAAIGARAFEIIEVLLQSANELVTKNDIMNGIWPGAIVGENTLQVHISAIRKALGPDRALLKTVSGRGYRLLGNWTPRQHGLDGCAVRYPADAHHPKHRPQAQQLPADRRASDWSGRGRAACARPGLRLSRRDADGPGGIGKTTLALEVARGLVADFDDGAWFVELASLSDPDLVPSAVASTLGLKLTGEVSADSVARAVGAKHLLLVLDNCEHVIDAAADLAERFTRCAHTPRSSRPAARSCGSSGEAV